MNRAPKSMALVWEINGDAGVIGIPWIGVAGGASSKPKQSRDAGVGRKGVSAPRWKGPSVRAVAIIKARCAIDDRRCCGSRVAA